MKLAICFFGLPRYYDLWKENFGSFYDGCDVDFYAHFWEDESLDEDSLLDEFNFKKILFEKQKTDFIELPKETDLTKISKTVTQTLSPLYSIKKVGSILEDVEEEYDFIILTRTDVGCTDNEKFSEFDLEKDNFYTSFVDGYEWLNTHLDVRWLCGSKEKIIRLCSVYDNLTEYIINDKISLCHHRLFFHALKEYRDRMEMVNVDPSYRHGGWFFIRNKSISEV